MSPTEKIGELWPRPCQDPDHKPPSHMVYEPGTYKHTCPSCGFVSIFHVPIVTM